MWEGIYPRARREKTETEATRQEEGTTRSKTKQRAIKVRGKVHRAHSQKSTRRAVGVARKLSPNIPSNRQRDRWWTPRVVAFVKQYNHDEHTVANTSRKR